MKAAGVGLTAVLAVVALWVHALPVWPFTVGEQGRHPVDVLLVAIVFGALLRNVVSLPSVLQPGIKLAVKKLLPFAIVLLGAKLDFFDVLRVSGHAIAINFVCVPVALGLTVWLCRRAKVRPKLGLLIGVGTAICGGTAIAVTAPVVEAEDSETAFAVTTITIFGLLSIVLYPAVGGMLELTQFEFGVWAGTSIHATPQVMAAAFSYGDAAGETAVIVKLIRVLLLAPVVVVIGAVHAARQGAHRRTHLAKSTKLTSLFPPFILGFLLLALAKTLGLLPTVSLGGLEVSTPTVMSSVSSFLIVMAMAGVGLGVDLRGLAKVGLTALLIGLFAAVVLSVFSLSLIGLLL